MKRLITLLLCVGAANAAEYDLCPAATSRGERVLSCLCQNAAANEKVPAIGKDLTYCVYNEAMRSGTCTASHRGMILSGNGSASCTKMPMGHSISCTFPMRVCAMPVMPPPTKPSKDKNLV